MRRTEEKVSLSFRVSPSLVKSYVFCPRNFQIMKFYLKENNIPKKIPTRSAVLGRFSHASFYYLYRDVLGGLKFSKDFEEYKAFLEKDHDFVSLLYEKDVIDVRDSLYELEKSLLLNSFDFLLKIRNSIQISEILVWEEKIEGTIKDFPRLVFEVIPDFVAITKRGNYVLIDIKNRRNSESQKIPYIIYNEILKEKFGAEFIILSIDVLKKKIYRHDYNLNYKQYLYTQLRMLEKSLATNVYPQKTKNCLECKVRSLCRRLPYQI